MPDSEAAQSIMRAFADSTGLSGAAVAPRRYLWTDAFAVCNYLGLARATGNNSFLDLAVQLVAQVHEVLGKHRSDSAKSGWLSGLPDALARHHPTCAGLRIGKPLPERSAGEPADEELEWQQDGQYFHYLTRWMHALNCVALQTGDAAYHRWARELAKIAYGAFVYSLPADGKKRMYWKMSVDLSRPLVLSMGHHDPLDGLVTCQTLEAASKRLTGTHPWPDDAQSLAPQIEGFAAMCAGRNWQTSDDLGIGSLLCDAGYLAQMIAGGWVSDSGLLEKLLADIAVSLRSFTARHRLGYPAEYRLAFRELGLAIGLRAVESMEHCVASEPDIFRNASGVSASLGQLRQSTGLCRTIVQFWLEPARRNTRSWQDQADINNVMLATSLAPAGYLQT
jgi:hypothetical protein